jgi:hypothetical protein
MSGYNGVTGQLASQVLVFCCPLGMHILQANLGDLHTQYKPEKGFEVNIFPPCTYPNSLHILLPFSQQILNPQLSSPAAKLPAEAR